MQNNTPDYHTLQLALEKLETEATSSEIHGTLTGLLCANSGAKAEQWQDNLWPHRPQGDLLAAEALEVFRDLHTATREQLNDPICDFQLLLPNDEEHIDQRVQALGDWSQGFLTGLAIGGIKDFKPLPVDAREIIEDLVEIARAGTSYNLEGGEEDEQAYAELTEYLRVGVMLINEELQPTQGAPQSESTTH